MKRISIFLMTLMMVFGLVVSAHATPVTYAELCLRDSEPRSGFKLNS